MVAVKKATSYWTLWYSNPYGWSTWLPLAKKLYNFPSIVIKFLKLIFYSISQLFCNTSFFSIVDVVAFGNERWERYNISPFSVAVSTGDPLSVILEIDFFSTQGTL